jgi:hypothetical protein
LGIDIRPVKLMVQVMRTKQTSCWQQVSTGPLMTGSRRAGLPVMVVLLMPVPAELWKEMMARLAKLNHAESKSRRKSLMSPSTVVLQLSWVTGFHPSWSSLCRLGFFMYQA